MWHSKDSQDRKEWNKLFEAITNWFCSSNGFMKNNNLIVNVQDFQIIFKGNEIKYLGPNLRSAASLVSKAYDLGKSLNSNKIRESTPGIYVTKNLDQDYPKPYFTILLNQIGKFSKIPKDGSIFAYDYPNAEILTLPASNLTQAIVWVRYGDMISID